MTAKKKIMAYLKANADRIDECSSCITYFMLSKEKVSLFEDAKSIPEIRVDAVDTSAGCIAYTIRIRGAWLYGWDTEPCP